MTKIVFSNIKYPSSLPEDKFSHVFDRSIITEAGMKGRKGENRGWIFDSRFGLANTKDLQMVADYFVDILDKNNINQVAVKGYGAYLLVGSVIVSSYTPITGCIIRESAKEHDRGRIIEGDYDPTKPILLMDDILNSGKSSVSAVNILKKQGWKNTDINCGFMMTFLWGTGAMKLHQQGLSSGQIIKGIEVRQK